MARFTALGMRITEKYFLYVFVFGFLSGTFLSVLSGPSEYDKNCKEAQKTTRQYLLDTYQIDGGGRMLLYENLCLASRTVEGTFSPSMKYLLSDDKEARKQLLEWLGKWNEHDLLKDCEEIMRVLSCEHNEPIIQKIPYFIFSVLLVVVLLVLGIIHDWDLRISGICGLTIGWLMGWYIVG